MDYTLDENQIAVKDLTATIVTKRATDDRLRTMDSTETWFDELLWNDLAQAGLTAMAIPDKWGGSGGTFADACLIIEEVAVAAAHVPLVDTMVAAALPLLEFGNDEQRERLLRPFADGSAILSTALVSGPAPAEPLHAAPSADGWELSGTVSHVAVAGRANRILVRADDESGSAGLFFLDPAGAGVHMTVQSSIDRQPRWQVRLEQALVDERDVLTSPSADARAALRWIEDRVVAARCVQQAGSASAALQVAATFVKEREQFGRALATFQAVAHRVADGYIDVEGVRLTAWRAVWLLSEGYEYDEALAIAAVWAADAPMRVAEAAMHVHGGMSVDLDYPIHRHYLNIKSIELLLQGATSRLADLGDMIAASS